MHGVHASTEPDKTRDLFGDPGGYGDHLAVYGRAGALSDRNRTQIQRIKYKGSWTYFCETQV